MSDTSSLVLADAVQISNPTLFTVAHSRAGTTFWFTLLVGFICLALSLKVPVARWMLYTALFLGFAVIVSTWLPGIGVGNSMRAAWQNLYDQGGFAKVSAIILFAGVLYAAYWGFNAILQGGKLLELVAGVIVAALATLVLCTVPMVQNAAVWYVDSIVQPVMNIFW